MKTQKKNSLIFKFYRGRKKRLKSKTTQAHADKYVEKILTTHPYLKKKHFEPVSVIRCFMKGINSSGDFMGFASTRILRELRRDVVSKFK